VPGSAEARVTVKAARLGSLRSCSSAPPVSFGQLVTAPLLRPGLGTGIEAAIGAGSPSKGPYYDDQDQQLPPDAPRALLTGSLIAGWVSSIFHHDLSLLTLQLPFCTRAFGRARKKEGSFF